MDIENVMSMLSTRANHGDAGDANIFRAVKDLLSQREMYARQAEDLRQKYQREHIDTNRWKNRAELVEAILSSLDGQEPVGRVDHSDDDVTGGEYFVEIYPNVELKLDQKLYVRPTPAQPIRKTNAWHHGCKFEGWQCFHCSEVFETVGGARDHFGADPTKEPGCLIKVKYGDERGLEMELRKAEEERDSLQYQIGNESTEADLRIQSMQGEHQIALRREEEKGYARGLDDGRKLRPLPEDIPHEFFVWYAKLTGADAVTDEGEHVGYCCTMEMMNDFEGLLAKHSISPLSIQEVDRKS